MLSIIVIDQGDDVGDDNDQNFVDQASPGLSFILLVVHLSKDKLSFFIGGSFIDIVILCYYLIFH